MENKNYTLDVVYNLLKMDPVLFEFFRVCKDFELFKKNLDLLMQFYPKVQCKTSSQFLTRKEKIYFNAKSLFNTDCSIESNRSKSLRFFLCKLHTWFVESIKIYKRSLPTCH